MSEDRWTDPITGTVVEETEYLYLLTRDSKTTMCPKGHWMRQDNLQIIRRWKEAHDDLH